MLCSPQSYLVRNEVIVSIGCCLSSGALQVLDDAEDGAEAAEEAAPQEGRQQRGGNAKAGKRGAAAKKRLAAVEEDGEEEEPEQGADAEAGSEFASVLPEEAELEEEAPLPPLASLRPSESTRAELLQLLTARVHDIHAFSRSKTLQTLASLLRSRSLAAHEAMPLPALAGERLLDASSLVRRAAVSLLVACMEFNPLGPDLQGTAERQRLQEMEEERQARQARDERSKEDRAREILRQHEQSGLQHGEGEEDEADQEAEELELAEAAEAVEAAADDPVLQQELRLRSALSFVDSVQAAVSAVCQLLDGRSSADVVKAVHCLVTAAQFHISQAQV